jgi:threonine dehydrogenase-like Zn-dependent dehydrogenase
MHTLEPIAEAQRAGVLRAPERLETTEIPQWPWTDYGDPDIVLVKVMACGVCGSDFRYFAGENPWAQHTLGRFVPNPPNIVLGHEFAGVVVGVQTEENRSLLGQRVAPICSKVCGRCEDCRNGRSRLCEATVHTGHGQGWGEREFYPGAYAHYVPVWGAGCLPIADETTFEEAAMMDILAVCLHVAEQGAVSPGRPVLCIGAGPAGNGVAQAALALGASHAVLLDTAEQARRIAAEQGIGHVLNPAEMSEDELAAALHRLAPHGFGSVFDTVGASATLSLGIRHLGKAGTLVNLAVHDGEMPLNFMRLGSERRIVTSCNFEVGDYPRALAWLEQGRFRVKEWLTPVTLDDLPARFAEIHADPNAKGAFKMVIDPWA